MMKRYKITIDRFTGYDLMQKEDWKDLISALVLAGYEVYGDNGKISFKLGRDDKLEEIDE